MRQVVLNLLQNAQQAMGGNPGDQVLTVRTRALDDRVLVEVLDTGPGMPADVLPRVFDAFFTTKKSDQGTGLGLWVSYDIVEQHGGRLTAGNRPEGGAVFTLDLPRRV
jgi:signal transduction histidine kinase